MFETKAEAFPQLPISRRNEKFISLLKSCCLKLKIEFFIVFTLKIKIFLLSQSVQECKNIDRCMCSKSFIEAANEFTIMKWFFFLFFVLLIFRNSRRRWKLRIDFKCNFSVEKSIKNLFVRHILRFSQLNKCFHWTET